MTANLTRRRMLAAAGIGTAAAAFSGAASAQCRNDLKWDETHEIVVVGAGGAGMAAAVKAAQTGAKDILVLEKLAFGVAAVVLFIQGRIHAAVLGAGLVDLLLAAHCVLLVDVHVRLHKFYLTDGP